MAVLANPITGAIVPGWSTNGAVVEEESSEPRMVKILETPQILGLAIIIGSHEEQQLGAAAGICDWIGKPTIVAPERIPGGGEPHSSIASAD